MKTKILIPLLLCLFFANYTNAQHDYIPMAVEGAQTLFYSAEDDWMPPWIDFYFGYRIGGDIEIDGIFYKEVYYRNFYPVDYGGDLSYPPLYLTNEVLIGAIRDDIINKKVYAIMFCDEFPGSFDTTFNYCPCYEEFLLYDFSMNIGDVCDHLCIVYNGELVDNIYTTMLFNEYRDIYKIGIYDPQGNIIEGVGSDTGLYQGVFYRFELPWIYLKDFCIGEDETCLEGVTLLSSKEEILKQSVNVFPNPANNYLYIINNENVNITAIQIFDVLGKLLLEKESDYQQIDISHLQPNVLYIKIQLDRGVLSQKIIKN